MLSLRPHRYENQQQKRKSKNEAHSHPCAIQCKRIYDILTAKKHEMKWERKESEIASKRARWKRSASTFANKMLIRRQKKFSHAYDCKFFFFFLASIPLILAFGVSHLLCSPLHFYFHPLVRRYMWVYVRCVVLSSLFFSSPCSLCSRTLKISRDPTHDIIFFQLCKGPYFTYLKIDVIIIFRTNAIDTYTIIFWFVKNVGRVLQITKEKVVK